MLLDRSRRDEDPWLDFKVAAFTVGAGLALAGIYFDARPLIAAAVIVLLIGYAVRFLDRGGTPNSDEAAEEASGEGS